MIIRAQFRACVFISNELSSPPTQLFSRGIRLWLEAGRHPRNEKRLN